jgi:glycosyltransferase involved in cell wall biosynthesis
VSVELTQPVASIVIPAFNQRPQYLAEAVNSALGQSVPVEVIVVDDGSDEPIPADGAPSNVRIIRRETNRGIAVALNTGIRAMTTDWWCWLSSDDLLTPDKVETQLKETLAASCLASHHGYLCFRTGERPMGYVDPIRWRTLDNQRVYLGRTCCVNGSTAMVHRQVFDDVGLFDESYRYGQDWEMWCRIGQKYLWHPIRKPLGSRREGENLTVRIEQDDALRAARNAEDDRIRARYRT